MASQVNATGPSPKLRRGLISDGYEPVGGAAAVETLRVIAQRRLAERTDAVMIGPEVKRVCVSDNLEAVEIQMSGDPESEITVTYLAGSTRWLSVVGGQLWYKNCDDFPYHWSELIGMADTMSLAPPLQVPYGMLSEDRRVVVGILFTSNTVDGAVHTIHFGTDSYVLEGELMPELLKTVCASGAWREFWTAVDAGTVVRLGRRLKAWPGCVEFNWSENQALLVLTEADGQSPLLMPRGVPYQQWWPIEATPGAVARDYGAPYTSNLKPWFRE